MKPKRKKLSKNSRSTKRASKNRSTLKILVPFDFLPETGYFLKPDLVASLKHPGVQIVPLLYDETDLKKKIQEADGLLIPGGVGDVDPELYDQRKRHACVNIIRSRCDFEFKLLDLYLPTEKPLLAICWGHQMLNVFMGGTLIQDIKSERPSSIDHVQKEPGHIPTHRVKIREGSEALKLFGPSVMDVNSTHHQAVDRLAPELESEGLSDDGLIECIRVKNHSFAWGVQWHPERLKDDRVIPSFLSAVKKNA